MKKSIDLTINGIRYEICYDIRSLNTFERLFGRSITSLFSGSPELLAAKVGISFTVAGIITGAKTLAGKGIVNEDEAYKLIDAYCADGGDLDHLNGIILSAIFATGLFTPGRMEKAEKPEAPAPTTKEK